MVNRWNSLDQETVDVDASTHLRAGLVKLEKQGCAFYGSCMVRKALGLMEIGHP